MKLVKSVFLAGVFLIAAALFVRSASATCSTGSFYNAFPAGVSNYPVLTLTGANGGWPGFTHGGMSPAPTVEDFEWPASSGLSLATAGKNELAWLDVTSGLLKSKWVTSPSYKRAFVKYSDGPFRAVFYAIDWNQTMSHFRVVNQRVSARFNFSAFESGAPFYQGAHLFARYRSEDEFYTISLRVNGDVAVKRQAPTADAGCPYSEIGSTLRLKTAAYPNGLPTSGSNSTLPTGTWYTVRADVVTNGSGNAEIAMYVNDVYQATFTDSTANALPDGLGGIRTDSVDTWVDDLKWEDL